MRLSTGSRISRVESIKGTTCGEVYFLLHNLNCSRLLNTSPSWLASADVLQMTCLPHRKHLLFANLHVFARCVVEPQQKHFWPGLKLDAVGVVNSEQVIQANAASTTDSNSWVCFCSRLVPESAASMPCTISNADCNSSFLSDNRCCRVLKTAHKMVTKSLRDLPNSQWVARRRNSAMYMYSITGSWGLWFLWWNVNRWAITIGLGSKYCCKNWVIWSSDFSWGFAGVRSRRMR